MCLALQRHGACVWAVAQRSGRGAFAIARSWSSVPRTAAGERAWANEPRHLPLDLLSSATPPAPPVGCAAVSLVSPAQSAREFAVRSTRPNRRTPSGCLCQSALSGDGISSFLSGAIFGLTRFVFVAARLRVEEKSPHWHVGFFASSSNRDPLQEMAPVQVIAEKNLDAHCRAAH